MLIVSRRAEESIIVSDDIKVTVLSVTGGKVRIGITAPTDVTIDREEVHISKRQDGPDRDSRDVES